MKKLLFSAGICLASLLASGLRAEACNPGCGVVRPVPVRPAPLPANPGFFPPAPPSGGGESGTRGIGANGDQVIWDLPAEEKARIRAAAKGVPAGRTVKVVRRP